MSHKESNSSLVGKGKADHARRDGKRGTGMAKTACQKKRKPKRQPTTSGKNYQFRSHRKGGGERKGEKEGRPKLHPFYEGFTNARIITNRVQYLLY